MKNYLRIVSMIVAVVIVSLGIVVVPVAAKGPRSITLINVSFIQGKGYVFKFNVNGDFRAKELQGAVYLSGHRYNLDCHSTDSGDLNCVAGGGLPQFAGRTVQGAVGGFAFSAVLPVPVVVTSPSTTYCFGVFDYDQDYVWGEVGDHCQDSSSPDDSIEFYNPVWNSSFTYYHYDDGSEVKCSFPPAPSWGEGYYYDLPQYC